MAPISGLDTILSVQPGSVHNPDLLSSLPFDSTTF